MTKHVELREGGEALNVTIGDVTYRLSAEGDRLKVISETAISIDPRADNAVMVKRRS